MLERRRLPRTRTFALALVIPRRDSLNCVVRDITSFGARLKFHGEAIIPTDFYIIRFRQNLAGRAPLRESELKPSLKTTVIVTASIMFGAGAA